MSEIELSKFSARPIEVLPPGIVTTEDTIAGRPVMRVSSAAQIGCMCFPPPEKKESPVKM